MDTTSLPIQTLPMGVDAMIRSYIQLRDRKQELDRAHKERLAKYTDAMTRLEGYLLEAMNLTGVDSVRSREFGTAFKDQRTSATVRDWSATLAFIREHERYDLLEARVSKLATFDLIKEMGQPVPGVETSSEVCVKVRRPTEK